MASDRVVLENIDKTGLPVMRVYRWKPYCISLGFRQESSTIDIEKCKENGVDVISRPTGGRAVFHAEELTYSVIIPQNNSFFSGGVQKVYEAVSRGLIRGIRKLGVPAELQKRSLDLRSHYKTSISVNCFSAAARSEVLVEGRKLIGSAQRHLQQGILQHGSILTGDKHLDLPYYLSGLKKEEADKMSERLKGMTVSMGNYLGKEVSIKKLTDAVKQGMIEELDIEFDDSEFIDDEKRKIEKCRNEFSVFKN